MACVSGRWEADDTHGGVGRTALPIPQCCGTAERAEIAAENTGDRRNRQVMFHHFNLAAFHAG
jgi:hypothetical protein